MHIYVDELLQYICLFTDIFYDRQEVKGRRWTYTIGIYFDRLFSKTGFSKCYGTSNIKFKRFYVLLK